MGANSRNSEKQENEGEMIGSVNGRECVLAGRLSQGDAAYFIQTNKQVQLLFHRLLLSIGLDPEKLHHNFHLTKKFGH